MAELARGDSAISKTFSQNWKWSHLISAGLQRRAEGALPAAVRRRPPLPARQGHHRADRRLRQPPAAEGRAQGRAEAARRAPGRRMDPQRREMLHRQRAGRQAVLHRRAHRPERAAAPGHHHVPGALRHAGLPDRQGVQQERLAVLSQRRDDLRERPRAARQRGRPGQHLRHEDRAGRRPHRRRPVRRPGTGRQRARRLRRRLRAGDEARQDRQARRPAADRAAAHRAQAQQDEHADRGAALVS